MIGLALLPPLPLPPPVQRRIDAAARELLQPKGRPAVDFTQPHGEEALVGPDSVSWRIFKNPVALFIGGGGGGGPGVGGRPRGPPGGGGSSLPPPPSPPLRGTPPSRPGPASPAPAAARGGAVPPRAPATQTHSGK